MKLLLTKQRSQGLTRTDIIVIILVAGFLALLLLPMFITDPPVKKRAQRINCVSNLKQVSLAARIWEGDNNNKYPMAVSVTNGGAMELVATGNVVACFQVFSNELSTTKILWCPADAQRTYASNFQNDFNNSHISYFINADANETYPQMAAFGDDNLAINGARVKAGIWPITSNTEVSWTSERHKCGNVAFADGSVAMESNQTMTNWFGGTNYTSRLAIP